MHGTFYLSGTLYHTVNDSRSSTRNAKVLENTHVGPRKSKPKKTTNKKKINQMNKKSESVTIQIPKKPRRMKIQMPELEELRSGEDTLMP